MALALAAPARAADARTYTAGNHILQIGNETASVRELAGGDYVGTVVEEPQGAGQFVKKHLGNVSVEPIEARVAPSQFNKFIADQLAGKAQGVDGMIQKADFNYQVTSQTNFKSAILTEIELSPLSGASKDAYTIGLTLEPQQVQIGKGGGSAKGDVGAKQKKALASNFRVTIPGVQFTKVKQVDAITISRRVQQDQFGATREPTRNPTGAWKVSNIVLYVSDSDTKALSQWYEQFVIKGNNGEDQEKTLTLELLDATMQGALMSVEFGNVGIVSMRPESGEAGQVAFTRIELYAERASFGKGSGGVENAAAAPSDASAPSDKGGASTAAPGGDAGGAAAPADATDAGKTAALQPTTRRVRRAPRPTPQ